MLLTYQLTPDILIRVAILHFVFIFNVTNFDHFTGRILYYDLILLVQFVEFRRKPLIVLYVKFSINV